MSKVQERETGILNSLTHTGIAEELESRLRDLERNIAVAREFIKLADESYSELRHKWNILQQERKDKANTDLEDFTTPERKKTDEKHRSKEHEKAKDRTQSKTEETEAEDSEETDDIPTFPMHQRSLKTTTPSVKKAEAAKDPSSPSSKKARRGCRSKTN